MKDRIFTQEINKQFEFDEQVASVFDDMLERSIPHYKEVIKLIIDFCILNLKTQKTNPLIYDLGSSTGTMLLSLYQALPSSAQLIGIDSSQAMVDKALLKAKAYGTNINFLCQDVLNYDFLPSNIIIANYTLQFIRPMQRKTLLQKIYKSLHPGGILFLSEKMTSLHKILDKHMIERYLRYKIEQGYSQSEIRKKRQSLENVLIPFSLDENIAMIKEVGFQGIEVLFKWVNFGSIIAIK